MVLGTDEVEEYDIDEDKWSLLQLQDAKEAWESSCFCVEHSNPANKQLLIYMWLTDL